MKKKTIQLCFIINGEDVLVHVGREESLAVGREKALAKSHNTGRPAPEWEIRDERGVLLPGEPKAETFDFKDGQRLFLTLKVGFGGAMVQRNGRRIVDPETRVRSPLAPLPCAAESDPTAASAAACRSSVAVTHQPSKLTNAGSTPVSCSLLRQGAGCGSSSAGRAWRCQRQGRGFELRLPL